MVFGQFETSDQDSHQAPQNRRDEILNNFEVGDLENPVTEQSIGEALQNVDMEEENNTDIEKETL